MERRRGGAAKKLIVFVHGLGATAESTWQVLRQRIEQDGEIGQDFVIEYYQYPTRIFSWPCVGRLPRLQTLALGLKSLLNNRYPDIEDVYFIAHSMGGLIVRRYILDQVKKPEVPRSIAALLYASPSTGAQLANLAAHLPGITEQVRQLGELSDFIEHLNDEWTERSVEKHARVQYVVGALDRVVSERSSRGLTYVRDYDVIPNATHGNITTPDNDQDLRYLIAKRFLQTPAKVNSSPAFLFITAGSGQLIRTNTAQEAAYATCFIELNLTLTPLYDISLCEFDVSRASEGSLMEPRTLEIDGTKVNLQPGLDGRALTTPPVRLLAAKPYKLVARAALVTPAVIRSIHTEHLQISITISGDPPIGEHDLMFAAAIQSNGILTIRAT